MLKVRVIPTLLWKDVGLVKGQGFDSWRRVGTALPAVKVYNTREVDELILVDILATREEREPDYLEVETIAAECFVPLTVGGGIRNLEQIKRLLRAGADKVCINSAAFESPDLVSQAADRYGSQCVVASVDARRNPDGSYECFSRSGTRPTGKCVEDWCRFLESLGAGEILLTSIERDGTRQGYDLELVKRVIENVAVPVIASGGAGCYRHMLEAVQVGASAVAAAAIFHYTEQTPLEAKKYLAGQGIAVRNAKIFENS